MNGLKYSMTKFWLNQGGVEIDLFDSYDANSNEDKGNTEAWQIPNILGIRPRK